MGPPSESTAAEERGMPPGCFPSLPNPLLPPPAAGESSPASQTSVRAWYASRLPGKCRASPSSLLRTRTERASSREPATGCLINSTVVAEAAAAAPPPPAYPLLSPAVMLALPGPRPDPDRGLERWEVVCSCRSLTEPVSPASHTPPHHRRTHPSPPAAKTDGLALPA